MQDNYTSKKKKMKHLPYFTFSYTHFWVLRAGKDWLEVPPTIDKFIVVQLLTNFASLPLISVP